MTDIQLCPCGSLIEFNNCCNPLLQRERHAETAEELMRSRYCAFFTKNVDYLLDTHHISQQKENEKQELTQTINRDQWIQLRIVKTQNGTKKDSTGTVEFIAIYSSNAEPSIAHSNELSPNNHDVKTKKLQQLHEISKFVKEDGCWFYLDGNIIDSTQQPIVKLNRNDPCWCGSGRKYKKCHG